MSAPINPTRVWVRHIKRAVAGVQVAAATFAPQPEEGVNGRQGWQRGDVSKQLSEPGEASLTFPNTAGEDGTRHLDRFAVTTDEGYVVGEEWIEVMREPDEPIMVFTPAPTTRTGRDIAIKGVDVAGFLDLVRSAEVDLWRGVSPRDVFEHYTQLPYLAAGRAFLSGWTGSGSGTDDGWDFANVTASNGAATFSSTASSPSVSRALAGVPADCWSAQGRIRVTTFGNGTAAAAALIITGTGGAVTRLHLRSNGDVYVEGGLRTGLVKLPRKAKVSWPAAVDLQIAARYDRLLFYVNGQLMGQQKRSSSPQAPATLQLLADVGTTPSAAFAGVFESAHLEALAPFALRGADKGDFDLPGLPTPGGLRARYYNEAATATSFSGADFQAEALNPLAEPTTDRLEPKVDFASGYTPPGLPGAWSLVLSGAIRLDTVTADQAVRLTVPAGITARVYVGRTLPGDQAWDSAAPTTYAPLRGLVGEVSGWLPIRIEIVSTANALAGALKLEVGPFVSSSPVFGPVPPEGLSPYGCFDGDVRAESHREMLKQITEQFGYQWVASPRTLESGEFPGQIIPRVREGADRAVVIDIDTGSELQVDSDATDAIDMLIVDASGIADPNTTDDQGQVTAKVIDYDSALGHLGLISDYESLSEITEEPMLRQRAGAILAIRASANEQVGVRATTERPLDPLPLTGELARMNWDPGDAVELARPDVGLRDPARQMTKVATTFAPTGFGAPTVTFRQRPRGAQVVMRRALRAGIAGQRNDPRVSPVRRYQRAVS